MSSSRVGKRLELLKEKNEKIATTFGEEKSNILKGLAYLKRKIGSPRLFQIIFWQKE